MGECNRTTGHGGVQEEEERDEGREGKEEMGRDKTMGKEAEGRKAGREKEIVKLRREVERMAEEKEMLEG